MKKYTIVFILFLAFTHGTCFAGERFFEGKIVVPEVEGPPQMIIKMTPPRSKDTPQQITISDEEGNFQFNDLEQGKYLLEMYLNNELIRREVIDTREIREKEIQLIPER